MQALILAGGLGTRLRNVVKDRPKPMAPVNGKPFLEYQLAFLKKNGIRDIVLSTGYMSEKIEGYFDSGKTHGVSITYVKEKESLGTGGAIKNAVNMLEKQFIVLNGDSLFLIDITLMIDFHKKHGADITLALAKVKDKSRYGSVEVDNNLQIKRFSEKEESSSELINGGIYLFEKQNIAWDQFPSKFSIEKDFFPQLVVKNKIFAFVSDSYFIDIGTVQDYENFGKQLDAGIVSI